MHTAMMEVEGLRSGYGQSEVIHELRFQAQQSEILELWDEYEAAATPEARLAKALDKLETILQHTQGKNPPEFDLAFNLGYGRQHTAQPELIAQIRAILDRETARLAEGGT